MADQGSDSVMVVLVVLGLGGLAGLLFRRRFGLPLPPDPWETASSEADEELPETPERLCCPHCLEANDSAAPFCASCGGPLGDTVTLDPLKQIRAQGWTILQAVNHPYRGLVLFGLWLLVLPPLAGTLVAAGSTDAARGPFAAVLLPALGALTYAVIVLSKATRNYVRLHRP